MVNKKIVVTEKSKTQKDLEMMSYCLKIWGAMADAYERQAREGDMAFVMGVSYNDTPEAGAVIRAVGSKPALLALVHTILLEMNDNDREEVARDLAKMVRIVIDDLKRGAK